MSFFNSKSNGGTGPIPTSFEELSQNDALKVAALSRQALDTIPSIEGITFERRNHLIATAALMSVAAARVIGDHQLEAASEQLAAEHWPHTAWLPPSPHGTMSPELWDRLFGAAQYEEPEL